MIIEKLFTIPRKVKDMEDPELVVKMQEWNLQAKDAFMVIHGGVTDVCRVIQWSVGS